MDEPGEGDQQEDGEAEEDMRLEQRVDVDDEVRRTGAHIDDRLRPVHEFHHLGAVEMAERYDDGGEAEQELRHQQHHDAGVGERGIGADARIKKPAVQKQRTAGKGHDSRDATHGDSENLLCLVADAEKIEDLDRREQPDQMAAEDRQYADMEQYRAGDELPLAQKLARFRLPREGVALVAHDAGNDHHGDRDIGIDAEDEVMHGCLLFPAPARDPCGREYRG